MNFSQNKAKALNKKCRTGIKLNNKSVTEQQLVKSEVFNSNFKWVKLKCALEIKTHKICTESLHVILWGNANHRVCSVSKRREMQNRKCQLVAAQITDQ